MRTLVISAMIILISSTMIGCGNGGGIGNDESIGSVTKNINDGWDSLENGNYDNALTKFTNALSFAEDMTLKVTAKTGLAWAHAKKGELEKAIKVFEEIQNRNNDANVGLAGAYLARGNPDDFDKAVQLLDHIEVNGGGITNYSSPHTGVSNAEAYAMLAYCHFLDNNEDKAKLYIKKARTLDVNNDSVISISETLEVLGMEIPN